MAVIEFRKVRCDCCGKEKLVEHSGYYPPNWFVISITEWLGDTGHPRYQKDVCSSKCVLKMANNLKNLPKNKQIRFRL